MTDEQYNKLGLMIGRGFNGVDEKLDTFRKDMTNRFNTVDREIGDVKLRQDNVAYKFEVDDHEKRIKRLEKYNGLAE